MVDLILIGIIIMLFSERIAKLIPDSKTGVVSWIRKGFKLLSLYTPNVK